MFNNVCILLFVLLCIFVCGCGSESEVEMNRYVEKQSDNQSGISNTAQEHSKAQQNYKNKIKKERNNEIKIGVVTGNAKQKGNMAIYLQTDSVEISSKNPYQFYCKVRIIRLEDEEINTVKASEKLDEYEFYKENGEIYFTSKNYFGWVKSGKINESSIAKKIYNYVKNNM